MPKFYVVRDSRRALYSVIRISDARFTTVRSLLPHEIPDPLRFEPYELDQPASCLLYTIASDAPVFYTYQHASRVALYLNILEA